MYEMNMTQLDSETRKTTAANKLLTSNASREEQRRERGYTCI
jgi:hypothetical protein